MSKHSCPIMQAKLEAARDYLKSNKIQPRSVYTEPCAIKYQTQMIARKS